MSAVELFVPLVLGLVLNELVGLCPWLARKIVRWSARRIADTSVSDRYAEEWLAGLEGCPGKLLQLCAALSIAVRASWQLRAMSQPSEPVNNPARGPRVRRVTFGAGGRMGGLGSYWGYLLLPLAITGWATGSLSWQASAPLLVLSALYFAFVAPSRCGAPVTHRSTCCNWGNGLLLGCHIRQHRWLTFTAMRRRSIR